MDIVTTPTGRLIGSPTVNKDNAPPYKFMAETGIVEMTTVIIATGAHPPVSSLSASTAPKSAAKLETSTPILPSHAMEKKLPAAVNTVRSEEHTSNSSHVAISYAVFCLKKKKH